jgi:hypothetical protein
MRHKLLLGGEAAQIRPVFTEHDRKYELTNIWGADDLRERFVPFLRYGKGLQPDETKGVFVTLPWIRSQCVKRSREPSVLQSIREHFAYMFEGNRFVPVVVEDKRSR